jgi:threonine dehydrogenase-like Zn-dependent dehydrogenase
MGEVVSVGSAVENLRPGDRVVVPFAISCGRCFFCQREQWSLCDNSNPNAGLAAAVYGFSCAGLFGYSHMMGGYAGGQAQMVRVPFADVGPLKVPPALRDEQVLFLSDIFPTGYMAAENCEHPARRRGGGLGCGPVGQFAIRSAWLLGAEKVIAIDREPARLSMAAATGADVDRLQRGARDRPPDRDDGRPRPDACIDCVGLEAYGRSPDAIYDRARTDADAGHRPPHGLRQAVKACRKGGVVSIPGVYGGFVDKLPLGPPSPRASPSRWARPTSSATCGRS